MTSSKVREGERKLESTPEKESKNTENESSNWIRL